ncbi:MSC domain-containing protein [Psidium guajava]|nr:MSC domain-containing protein [Psidium guajava]
MSSTPKKRPKPKASSPSPPSSSRRSPIALEPPQFLFPSKQELLRLVIVLAIASSVAVTCNFFANFLRPQTKPFCDSDIDPLDAFADDCEPCPSHGECHQGKLDCARGYRKLGRSCVEDGDINETARKLSEWVENRLCEANAQLLCYGTGTAWVPVEEMWNDLDRHPLMKNFGWDTAIFIYTKQKAVEIAGKIMESRTDFSGMKDLKCPDSVAEPFRPYTCRIRQWLFKHVLLVVPVSLLLVASAMLFWKVRRRWHLSRRVEELYHQVCDILEENALTSKKGNGETEPWVVAARLRDHLLLPKERKDRVLWKKVEELVQEDSRIDRYPKLVKGESKVVWEWQVEGSLSSSRSRKKGEQGKLKSSHGGHANFIQSFHESRRDLQASPHLMDEHKAVHS